MRSRSAALRCSHSSWIQLFARSQLGPSGTQKKKCQREFSSVALVHKKQKTWVTEAPPQRQQFQPRGHLFALLPTLPSQSSRGLALHHPSRGHPDLWLHPGLRSSATSASSWGTIPPSAPTRALLSCLRPQLALHRAMRWCGPSHEQLE